MPSAALFAGLRYWQLPCCLRVRETHFQAFACASAPAIQQPAIAPLLPTLLPFAAPKHKHTSVPLQSIN
jgi:hypothetical protein